MGHLAKKQSIENKAHGMGGARSLLERVNIPDDLKSFSTEELKHVADELRSLVIGIVSKTGGHLGAGLGVVELTTAIHAIFDTPRDTLIWDVGHQSYPHKILTERKNAMHTLRQSGGLSGFTKRSESEYDPFGAAHSSTSISAGIGFAVSKKLQGDDSKVICVIGDGAMSAGMVFEAMNNADGLGNLIVILNDNHMSIAPPVGAISSNLADPNVNNAVFFESMGFEYQGPFDGHDMNVLLDVLSKARDTNTNTPLLIHLKTQKGKGYAPAEGAKDKMHGVKNFDVVTGTQSAAKISAPTYTKVFAQELIRQAHKDEKIVAITAAMPDGTGLDIFASEFPNRAFDVGIAEQHAVTFAAGLAADGMKPFVAIYSTFLQRAYDQIVHDVAIQKLPVKFAIDRSGLVGADGATHAGSFDTASLGCLPNFVLMAASDELELQHMIATAVAYNDGPIAFRYPRGEGIGATLANIGTPLEIGQGRIVYTSPTKDNAEQPRRPLAALSDLKETSHAALNDTKNTNIALLSYGARLQECMKAAQELEVLGKTVTIADARFAKPLDEALIDTLVNNHDMMIMIEEGSIGGFGSFVLDYLARSDQLDKARIKTMHLPDTFQDHATPKEQYAQAGLMADDIVRLAIE